MVLNFLNKYLLLFCFLCALLIPFPLALLPGYEVLINNLLAPVCSFIAAHILGLNSYGNSISSDSVLMYVLVFLLCFVAALITPLLKKRGSLFLFIKQFLFFYVVLILLKYGFDKLFKAQFYLPEPNTLFTPAGYLDKDIMYWSTIGTSYGYNLFLGIAEIIAAVFLLIKPLRIVGLLLCTVLFVNIVMVNFGFDISVKVYALLLLLMTLVLLAPEFMFVFKTLVLKQSVNYVAVPVNFPFLKRNPALKTGLNIFVCCLLFSEALYPHLMAGNYNDDKAPRPLLHGAYKVICIVSEKDTLDPCQYPTNRFFVHRKGYFITQNNAGEMTDYRMLTDSLQKTITLFDYEKNITRIQYSFSKKDNILKLQMPSGNKNLTIWGKSIVWQNLPLLSKGFHWTVEGVK